MRKKRCESRSLNELMNLPYTKICFHCGQEFHCKGTTLCDIPSITHCCCFMCYITNFSGYANSPDFLDTLWRCWGIKKGSKIWKQIRVIARIGNVKI